MGEAKRKAELMAKCDEEMKIWGDRLVRLDVDIQSMLIICGALQLSLRHPTYGSSEASKAVRKFLFMFKEQIGEEQFPALRELIELGFHRKFDQ